ncbi:MAG: transketolase, partial [Oscillospiraceae bacterium]
MDNKEKKQLQLFANTLREDVITAIYCAQSGHPGGSLSICDTLAYLYTKVMRIDPKNPKWEDRDRFVLSKGHTCPALYSVLAELGYFPKEELKGLRKYGRMLQGHPDMNTIPGIDMSSGSLGQGISAAVGMALAGKLAGKNFRVFTILGDGEIDEGQVWEAAMSAAHRKLGNLIAIVDYNGIQLDGPIAEISGPEPIPDKFQAFGWRVITCDGHDFDSLEKAFNEALTESDKPTCIVQKTVKGKGVSFMENTAAWHGKAPNEEQYNQAMSELENIRKGL